MPLDDLNTLSLPDLFDRLTAASLDRLLDAAFEEDLGLAGDVTSRSIISVDRQGEAAVVARSPGVIAGLAVVPRVCERFEQPAGCSLLWKDGEMCEAGRELAHLSMPLRDLLAIERTMLNLIGRLSGVATLARKYVDAIDGTGAVICDTRKTTPGLRALEKYAVRCGGGVLHRLGLHDAVLFKDNHLAHFALSELASELTRAAASVREKHDLRFVEVEVDTIEQLAEVLSLEPGLIDVVLLDNMPVDVLNQAVAMRNERVKVVQLEASGGVTLENVRTIAETGVDRISVGALTHTAAWLDVALDMRA